MNVKVIIEFCTMFEPGENAPPQFETESPLVNRELASVPRFKDRIEFGEHVYVVLDVVYKLNELHDPPVYIKAVRRVFYAPKSGRSRGNR